MISFTAVLSLSPSLPLSLSLSPAMVLRKLCEPSQPVLRRGSAQAAGRVVREDEHSHDVVLPSNDARTTLLTGRALPIRCRVPARRPLSNGTCDSNGIFG